jgi:cysteinyl-tRNA synthetase
MRYTKLTSCLALIIPIAASSGEMQESGYKRISPWSSQVWQTRPGLSTLNAINETYSKLGGEVLGLIPGQDVTGGGDSQREAALVEMLIDMRAQARVNKNYAESDRIRDELAKIGVLLEDRADGTIWRIQ